jgi:hypothetical protein
MDNQQHTTEKQALQLLEKEPASSLDIFSGKSSFEEGQRMAIMLSKSTMVPKAYQGPEGVANCVVALEMSTRMRISPLMVMQNLHVIDGKPSWASPFVIARLNSCGRFSKLRFNAEGGNLRQMKNLSDGCFAFATSLDTGDILEGTKVTWQMANDEGWLTRKGSKWQTMPDQMFRYRAATFFCRLWAPDLLMGMYTADEMMDIGGRVPTVDVNADALMEAQRQMEGATELADLELIDGNFPELVAHPKYVASRIFHVRRITHKNQSS